MSQVVLISSTVQAEEILRAAAMEERAEANLTNLVGKWNRDRVWETTKTRSPVTWLAFNLRIPKSRARTLLGRARGLQDMALVAAAYADAAINSCHVDKLIEVFDSEIAEVFARDEEMLLGFAKSIHRFAEFEEALRAWQLEAFASLGKTKTERQQKERKLHMSQTFEGMWRFDGWIDPITGEIVNNELRRLADQLFEEDWAEAKAVWGEETITAHIKRDDAQRLSDAFGLMASRSAVSDGKGRVVVSVMMGNEAFAQAFVDMGRRSAFGESISKFIRFRDRYCTDESGCDVPAHLCEVDHDLAWSRGGESNDDNGRSMCALHNRKKGAGPPQQRRLFGNDPPPAA